MRVAIVISLILAIIVIGLAFPFSTSAPEPNVQGNISIQQMLCKEQEGNADITFLLTANNTTNQHLRNLSIGLNIANGATIQEKVIKMNLVEEGETIKLEEIIEFQGDITACFAKFKQGNQELKANFRPTGVTYENN